MKVSVIIPTYNRLKQLKELAIPSVQRQVKFDGSQYDDYELIVIDDGSTEDEEGYKHLGKYLNEVASNKNRYFRLENGGKSRAVNFAVKQAKGEYILVVDDDNELMPTYLEETVKKMEEVNNNKGTLLNTEYEAICTGRIIKHSGFDDYAPAYRQSGYGFTAIDWGWLFKKKVFDVIQYDENMIGDEDADFGIQFFKHFRAFPLDKPLQIAYAEGPSVCYPTEKRLEALDRFIAKNWKDYELAGPKDLSFLYRFAGRNWYLAGYKKKAISYFWRCFQVWPNQRTLTHFLVSLINYKAYYQLMRTEEKYYARKRMAMPMVADTGKS